MARGEGRKTRNTGTFGSVDQRPSGLYRARYFDPDGRRQQAPTLFLTKQDARAWLALRQSEIIRKVWTPPEAEEKPQPKLTFKSYASTWLVNRRVKGQPLKDRTREHYEDILDKYLYPEFGALPIASITADDIRTWHDEMADAKAPTLRAHCYSLMSTIMATAATDRKISANPCVIRGAGTARRVHKIREASLEEIEIITRAMPEQYQAMVLLASWCALRFGELTELRRRDVIIVEPTDKQIAAAEAKGEPPPEPYGTVRVERAVVRVSGEFKVTTPKSDAGERDVEIPPHLLPVIKDHLTAHVGPAKDALLFPAQHGGHLAPATLYRQFYKARTAANRDDLRWHDLRHSGAVLAAATGATLAELMQRLGHSTPQAAMRYQHAARGRDRQIARQLSKLVENGGA